MEFTISDKELEGIISKKQVVSGFLLKELVYPPNTGIPRHNHEDANFCMAVEGGCTEIYGSKSRDYKPYSIGFLPVYCTHSLKTYGAGMRAFSINISPLWLERMREYSLNVKDSVFCSRGNLIHLQIRLYRESQNIDAASPMAVEGLVMEMLAETSRLQTRSESGAPPYWLKQAREIAHEQFSANLSLDEIARQVAVHPVHLARMFRKYYRCTIGDYVRQIKIENACREILAAETPLIEIALKNGFSDQSHFTRIFKRLKGLTPADYRANFRAR